MRQLVLWEIEYLVIQTCQENGWVLFKQVPLRLAGHEWPQYWDTLQLVDIARKEALYGAHLNEWEPVQCSDMGGSPQDLWKGIVQRGKAFNAKVTLFIKQLPKIKQQQVVWSTTDKVVLF